MLKAVKASFSARFIAWQAKHHPPAKAWHLTQNRIYIVPTRHGIFLLLSLFAMLLACINYQLNLGYAVVFLIASIAIGAMARTHNTLKDLHITLGELTAQAANTPIKIPFVFSHTDQNPRLGITLRYEKNETALPAMSEQTSFDFMLAPAPRGVYMLSPLTLETRYPLGLWRAWSVLRCDAVLQIYPQAIAGEVIQTPEADENLNAAAQAINTSSEASASLSHSQASSEANLKTIDWRALARDKLAEKVFDTESQNTARFTLSAPPHLPREQALSHLTAAVLAYSEAQQSFGLNLAPQRIAISQGAAHTAQCLRALAASGIAKPMVLTYA